jgi:hypothetical protein
MRCGAPGYTRVPPRGRMLGRLTGIHRTLEHFVNVIEPLVPLLLRKLLQRIQKQSRNEIRRFFLFRELTLVSHGELPESPDA